MKSNYAVMVPYRVLQAFDIYTALVVSELIKWDEFYRRDHENRWENLPEEFQQEPGWFYKSQNDWDVLGISWKKLSKAKTLLQELGILETIKKGPNIRIWYHFDQMALDNHLQNQQFFHIAFRQYGKMEKATTESTSDLYDDNALNDDRDDENDHTLNESNENSHLSKTDNSNSPKRRNGNSSNGQNNEIIEDYAMNDDAYSKNDRVYPENNHADSHFSQMENSISPKWTNGNSQNGQMEMAQTDKSNSPNGTNPLYNTERTYRKDIREDNSTILPIVPPTPSDHQNLQESKKSKTEAEAEADDPFKKFWTKWSDRVRSYPERFDERSQTVRKPSSGIRSRASANYQALLKKKINGDLVTPVMIEKAARSYFASLPDDGFGVANCSTWLKLDNIEQYLEEESLGNLSRKTEESLSSFETPREPARILPRPEPIFDPFDWIDIDEKSAQFKALDPERQLQILQLQMIREGNWDINCESLDERMRALHPDYQNSLQGSEHTEESLGDATEFPELENTNNPTEEELCQIPCPF